MFPSLPNLPFIGTTSGGTGGIPGITFPGGGPVIWAPPTVIPGFGGDTGKTGGGSVVPVASSAGAFSSFASCVLSPTTCLLRFVLLIIGLICIIGAIYLYKPTQEIVAAPARAVRDTAKAAGEGLAASAA